MECQKAGVHHAIGRHWHPGAVHLSWGTVSEILACNDLKSKTTEAEEVKASDQATSLTAGHQSRDSEMFGN